jgi:demethylmenaquinone methyltransferase/2-methoxy-6-polyprenyl-1,4-benzoquinol methylase
MPVEQYLSDPSLKQRFVTPMFDIIAPRYDAFTRVFSFGMDAQWKRELVDAVAAAIPPDAVALDLACGTGDLAFALSALAPRGRITGIDASSRMIEAAVLRHTALSLVDRDAAPHAAGLPRTDMASGRGAVAFAVGDLTQLEVADASVDTVTAGYALRNVPDVRAALIEIARVLKPGGRLYTLDFYRPARAWWRRLFVGYLDIAGNAVGWLWHREPVVYGYIARSVDHFVSAEVFTTLLQSSGFTVERVGPKLLGGIALHVARRLP